MARRTDTRPALRAVTTVNSDLAAKRYAVALLWSAQSVAAAGSAAPAEVESLAAAVALFAFAGTLARWHTITAGLDVETASPDLVAKSDAVTLLREAEAVIAVAGTRRCPAQLEALAAAAVLFALTGTLAHWHTITAGTADSPPPPRLRLLVGSAREAIR